MQAAVATERESEAPPSRPASRCQGRRCKAPMEEATSPACELRAAHEQGVNLRRLAPGASACSPVVWPPPAVVTLARWQRNRETQPVGNLLTHPGRWHGEPGWAPAHSQETKKKQALVHLPVLRAGAGRPAGVLLVPRDKQKVSIPVHLPVPRAGARRAAGVLFSPERQQKRSRR